MFVKKIILKVIPYLVSLILGISLFILSYTFDNAVKGLFLNLSAAFFAVPLLFLGYEIVKTFSNRKLNKEINDYIKVQVDTEILSILTKIMKIIYEYTSCDFSSNGIRNFLNLEIDNIRYLLQNRKFLGFQVYKNWTANETALLKLIENNFISNRLDNEWAISIIRMIKNIRSIEQLYNHFEIFEPTGQKSDKHEVFHGVEINEKNVQYPERYILIKKTKNVKGIVLDVGDFDEYRAKYLLDYFIINNDYLEDLCYEFTDIVKEIENWLKLTGYEFLIDPKMFRIVS